MALDQLEAFLQKMQSDPALKNEVLAASTADDVARIALKLGFEFSGDGMNRTAIFPNLFPKTLSKPGLSGL